jgi:hypothetical protein
MRAAQIGAQGGLGLAYLHMEPIPKGLLESHGRPALDFLEWTDQLNGAERAR